MPDYRAPRSGITRRRFLQGAGAAGALLAAGGARSLAQAATARPAALPSPAQSGIEHIVVLVMENRSFDHFLGWVPGADGRQDGLSYADGAGRLHDTHRLRDWSGCGFNDPDHSYNGGRVQFNGGRLDGFRRGANDDYALGYYTEADVPTNSALAKHFTVFDRWFCSILGPTYPNRFYTHAAATDRISNTMDQSSLPTIWNRLSDAGVSANYFFSDLPFLGLFGPQYIQYARPFDLFYVQAASGTLPQYTYLDPFFLGEDQGGSNDDHPHADIRRGQSLIAQVANAVMSGPAWDKTVLVITYDEWGGFFDHVKPPMMPDNDPKHAQVGFRVPTYLISPFAKAGHVNHQVFDHSSILKMVEWRFGLKPLTPRDAAASNLAEAIDFSKPNKTTAIPNVVDPGPHLCQGDNAIGMGNSEPFWEEFAASPLMRGWDVVHARNRR
ncbi:MAG: alkaline phosphatase family protein [Actinobacteria bacterium]|nr:alkaline phosphatase family protein [Actinomycetota bacterium]